MLFAELDPLGGWGQIILQGGSFVLLVYIIVIMYPRATREAREERASRDQLFAETIAAMNVGFEIRATKLATSTEENAKLVARAAEKQTKEFINEVRVQTVSITNALAKVCLHPR